MIGVSLEGMGTNMTIYYVGDKDFTSLAEAKKEMRRTGKKGEKVKVWANGDWEPCGEILLKGSNRWHIVGGGHDGNAY